MTNAATLGSFGDVSGSPLVFRNKLINGDMYIWQRGASFTPTSLATIYTTDRWACYRPAFAAGMLVSRQTASGLQNFPYALRVERSSGNAGTTAMQANQSIESITCYGLQGKDVTLSFYARCGSAFSATSSVLTSSIVTGTGTDQSLANTGYTGQASIDQANTVSTSWQRFTQTVNIATTVNEITVKVSYLPTGTSAGNDWYEITGVQLELGSAATPFEQRPVGMELSLCQRYYQLNSSVTVPLLPQGSGGNNTTGGFYLPVSVRAATSGTHTGIIYVNGVSQTFSTRTWSISSPSFSAVNIVANGGPSVYGNSVAGTLAFEVSAEL